MPHELWKRSCGLSRWLSSRSFTSDAKPTNSPISKLPVELLGEIFLSTLREWEQMTEELSKLPLSPLTLSHVCADWREITLSLPMLWSSIWIDRPRAAHVPMVALWLDRSHSFPLSIHLRQTDHKICLAYPSSEEHQFTEEILAQLVPHFARWQVVELLFKSSAQQELGCLPQSGTPILEHVSLDLDSWDACSADQLQTTLFSQSSLRSIIFHPGSQPNDICWPNLTTVVTNGPECTADTVLGILGASTSLTTAQFTLSDQPDWAPPFLPPNDIPVVLPTLKLLALKAHRAPLASLLSRLVLPALEALTLDYAYVVPKDDTEDQDAFALRSLLVRSACSLKSFTLREINRSLQISEHRQLSILRVLAAQATELEELAIEAHLTDRIVEYLAVGPENQEGTLPLKNLQHISMTDVRGEHLAHGLLAVMVLARPGLKTVDLHVRVQSHEDWIIPGEVDAEVTFERLSCTCVNP